MTPRLREFSPPEARANACRRLHLLQRPLRHQIRATTSSALQATNVTMRAHAIRKPEHVRTHRNKTALRVATVTLVRKPTPARQQSSLDQIQSPEPRRIK